MIRSLCAFVSVFLSCAGSCVVPLKLAQKSGVEGLQYVPPFGIAVFILTMVMIAGEMAVRRRLEPLHAHQVALPGMAGGVLWSIGTLDVLSVCMDRLQN